MTILNVLGLLAAFITAVMVFHICEKFLNVYNRDPKAPLCFPWSIPVIKSTISFVFNGSKFYRQASHYCQGKWPLRVDIVNDQFYLVQGAKNIAAIFNHPGLAVTRAYSIVLKHCFGMGQEAVDIYVADTSGSRETPIPGSDVPDSCRISYHTHKNLVEGLLGPGYVGIAERIEGILYSELNEAVPKSDTWTHGEDLTEFFEDHVGTAVLMGLFGPLLIKENPNFNRRLWQYDKGIMALAKRLPAWLIPKAYRLRDELIDTILQWHETASQLSGAILRSCEKRLGNADPYWGSVMMRQRYQMLLGTSGQTARSVASTDLAFMWATITNVVPSTMTLCSQIFSDSALRDEIRTNTKDTIHAGSTLKFDVAKLENVPILLSMYAETLRFGVQIHIPRCSPHRELNVGGSRVPANKLILINTDFAHNDESVWNTREGDYPLNTFWSRRFILDPTDPTSGPLKRAVSNPVPPTSHKVNLVAGDLAPDKARFTLEGLEGSFIPFGGGLHACPGRLLAKRIMLITGAMVATMFEIEILNPETLKFDAPRFGFGVRKPLSKVPYRIRRARDTSHKHQ